MIKTFQKNSFIGLLLMLSSVLTAQRAERYTISGYVRDNLSSESLIAATVYYRAGQAGTITNQFGFYSLTLPAGEVELIYSYVGYNTQTHRLHLSRDTTINIHLAAGQYLQEVEVTANRTPSIQENTRMSTINMPVSQIRSLPTLLGETDVMKALQLLPGIQSGGEGSTGLYVRGGGPDQNLILLDGVPVYNTSHFAGLFSVFNADAIHNMEVVKGGFPARYGGRISSVIDINLKEGHMQEFRAEGSIGIISAKLTVEGPIVKNRTSFIISGRRSLFMPFLNILTLDKDAKTDYYFYDLTAKINHRFSDKDRIYLSAYMGDDRLYTSSKWQEFWGDFACSYTNQTNTGVKWGNITSVFRWNHIFTNRLFGNTTLTYSRYRLSNFSKNEITQKSGSRIDFHEYYELQNSSSIEDWGGKIAFDFFPSPNHYIRFGGGAIYHAFNPTTIAISENDGRRDLLTTVYAYEYSAYAEDDIRLSERIKTNIGLHWGAFKTENMQSDIFQPRISARYLITPQLSFKASYSRMAQFSHLLTNADAGIPTDIWVPSTELLRPQVSDQVVAGLAQNVRENYEISLEGFYKTMDNVLEYKDGVRYFNLDETWDQKIVQGSGRSYGVELFVQKKTGVFTGWAGYTLAWVDRHFDELNGGRRFPYKYDRRHDVSLVGMLVFGKDKKHELSGTWVLGSGNWVTLPIGVYDIGHPMSTNIGKSTLNRYYEYGDRNGYRLPPYHRLDLSVTFVGENKLGEHRWVFGVYNVYNRKNPYYVDIEVNRYHTRYKIAQYSLLPFIPSVSYQFRFKF